MINSRTKGKTAERELANLLGHRLGLSLERNLDQWRSGGFDLLGLPGVALEVKRCETVALKQWWNQTLSQAGRDLIPVLAYRQSRKPWAFVVPLSWLTGEDLPNDTTATLDLDGFCQLVQRWLIT